MNEFLDTLSLDAKLKMSVADCYRTDTGRVQQLAVACRNNGFDSLQRCDDMLRLTVCIYYAMTYTLPQYKELDIPTSVFYDTIGDIDIWCRNNNNRGLRNYSWISNHLDCKLFRLGRLQFQLGTAADNHLDYDCLPYSYGERVIFVHIPQGEPLLYDACVSSIDAAVGFFARYFPDYDYRFMVCESWLMYDGNYLFMQPGCNILQFQSLFEPVYSSCDDAQAIERIFGRRRLLKSLYPTKTTLQQNAVRHMRQGGSLGTGIGIIDISER